MCHQFSTQTLKKTVCDPISKSQHRPVAVNIRPVIRATENKSIIRFNYRKSKWEGFTSELDDKITNINPNPENYETFLKLVRVTSKKFIPRGCRKNYIPGITDQNKEIYAEYIQAYNSDPFAQDTIELGETLVASVANERRER